MKTKKITLIGGAGFIGHNMAIYLKKKGFAILKVGKLNFFEQIHLFQNAKIIIGAHGAAFANLIFCKPNTKVLDIIPENHPNTVDEKIAKLKNLDFKYIKTKELLLNSVREQDIKLFDKILKKFNKVGDKLEDYVKDCISKLHKLNLLNDKFNETIYNKNSLYCTLLKPTKSLIKLVQIREILLYYKNVIEKSLNGEDEPDINEAYFHISTEF